MGTHNRFRVEERSGIIAVLDTKHADYKDTRFSLIKACNVIYSPPFSNSLSLIFSLGNQPSSPKEK